MHWYRTADCPAELQHLEEYQYFTLDCLSTTVEHGLSTAVAQWACDRPVQNDCCIPLNAKGCAASKKQ